MPFINLKTSAAVSDEKADELKSRFGKSITCLGKSEAWLMVNVEGGKKMYFKGAEGDTAIAEIALFGKAGRAQYDKMTEETCRIISDVLGISSGRIYVKYEETEHWGIDGFNF